MISQLLLVEETGAPRANHHLSPEAAPEQRWNNAEFKRPMP